jgi:23S rRNA (guanosine2251-2'-O)-methyltransferase
MSARYLFGFHAISARMRAQPESIQALWVDQGRDDPRARDLAGQAAAIGVRVLAADTGRLDGMVRGARHQGVVAEIADMAPRWGSLEDLLDALTEPALVVVLDGVTDPHNLGAVLRAADGAGAHAVIAPRDRAAGVSAVVARVAAGAAESVPYFMVPNLARELRALKDRGLWAVGLAEEGERELYAERLDQALALVLGAEGSGLRRLTRDLCDALVRIPMRGSVRSLNVAVAAGVCLFEARRQRMAPGSVSV